MGDQKGMGDKNHTVKLYSSQADIILAAIERDGVCYSKEAYVRRKYQESAPIFTTAYYWFVKQMENYVPKPEKASTSSPTWWTPCSKENCPVTAPF